MNWFKRMVVNWVREDWGQSKVRGSIRNYNEVDVDAPDESPNGDPVLNFRVYSAVGGRVVEFRHFDKRSGNNETTTYIITEDQNFGERIAKIATLESLKV